jgi:hypothetical protein
VIALDVDPLDDISALGNADRIVAVWKSGIAVKGRR